MTYKKTNNFVTGALVIAISNLLVKAIGAAYKIPLDRFILLPLGMGIYNASYIIYNWLFVVSTAGLPVAISKMIAEAQARGNYREAKKTFHVAQTLLFIIGIISFGVMFFGAKLFAGLISAQSTYLTMLVMSPSLFFVASACAYRGFYQGRQNMFPTAVSEVIEALSKLIFGLALSYTFKSIFWNADNLRNFMNFFNLFPPLTKDISQTASLETLLRLFMEKINFIPSITSDMTAKEIEDAITAVKFAVPAAAAIAGVTIGTCFSFLYLFIYNKIKFRKYADEIYKSPVSPSKTILVKLIKIAIPITIGVSVFTLTSVIDMAMVMNQLSWLGFPEIERGSMYGYLGRAITMFSFPPTIISAIAISIVPAIAAALAVKNKEAALNNAKSAFRLTILFAIPCSVGLSALARPILQLLYADGSYYLLLTVMGLAVMFVTMVQVCNAVLQAWGKVWVPVVNMAAGGIVKVIVNLLLVSHPAINIYGAPIGTLCCYLTVTALNIHSLKKVSGIKFEFADFILKPVVSAVVTVFCALAAYEISYPILNRLTGNYANLLAVALSIGLAGTGYFVCLLLIKGFKREDILLLPKGERIANLFKL